MLPILLIGLLGVVVADPTCTPVGAKVNFTAIAGQCVALQERADGVGYDMGAATTECTGFGPNYNLVRIYNQYQNNAYSVLNGEGMWDLAWIGASCKNISTSFGFQNAWVWHIDQSLVLDGYMNFEAGTDSATCNPGDCLNMGGAGYYGKWRSGPCTDHLTNAICAENFNTDAPTPAPAGQLTCDPGWQLFKPLDGDSAPTMCYQLVSKANASQGGYTFTQAEQACANNGAVLAKIEDVTTNVFVMQGVSAWGIAWVGGRCFKDQSNQLRYYWQKDRTLVAAGYTNFPQTEEINPCTPNTCVSLGGAGYDYQWRTGSCTNTQIDDAICEKYPNGYGPTPVPGPIFPTPPPTAPTPGPAVPTPGFPTPGGQPTPGFPTPGFPTPGFPTPGFPTPGFPTPGFPTPGFPTPGGFPTPYPSNPTPPVSFPTPPAWPGPGGGKSSNSGAIAAGVLVPLMVLGGAGFAFHMGLVRNPFGGSSNTWASGYSSNFVSTGTYSAAPAPSEGPTALAGQQMAQPMLQPQQQMAPQAGAASL